MNIDEAKREEILPEFGTPVRTDIDPLESGHAFLVASKHQKSRKNAEGTYAGYVAGCGGDVWWIDHGDGDVGAYLTTEVFDRE